MMNRKMKIDILKRLHSGKTRLKSLLPRRVVCWDQYEDELLISCDTGEMIGELELDERMRKNRSNVLIVIQELPKRPDIQ